MVILLFFVLFICPIGFAPHFNGWQRQWRVKNCIYQTGFFFAKINSFASQSFFCLKCTQTFFSSILHNRWFATNTRTHKYIITYTHISGRKKRMEKMASKKWNEAFVYKTPIKASGWSELNGKSYNNIWCICNWGDLNHEIHSLISRDEIIFAGTLHIAHRPSVYTYNR